MRRLRLLLLLLLLHVVCSTDARPTTASPDDDLDSDVVSYLSSYGYLPSGVHNQQTSVATVRSALSRLQAFAGLTTTGKLDPSTRQLLATKRCGLPDIPSSPDERSSRARRRRQKRYVVNGAKWPNTTVTWRLATWTSRLGEGKVLRVLHDALGIWEKSSALKFVRVAQEPSDVQITFARGEHGDGYAFDGPDVVLAHAFYPGQGMGGDVHFDDAEEWTDNNQLTAYSREVNLLSVAAHEFGHSLGLGHSKVHGALMFPYYQYGWVDPDHVLHYDDIVAIQSIYGRGSAPEPTRPAVTSSTQAPSTRRTTAKPTTEYDYPDVCTSSIDALSRIRNEIMLFKNRWFWRFDQHGFLLEAPADISRFWNGLPPELDRVDAVYERPDTDTIVFFAGRQYWEFRANHVKPGYPKNLTALGLPDTLEKVDAVFVWEYNGATYIFAGDEYYKLDEVDQRVEISYPRKLALWRDLPEHIDAAFTNRSAFSHYAHEREVDTSYFFKANQVYKFSTFFMRVEKGYPIRLDQFWAHCRKNKMIGEFVGGASRQSPQSWWWTMLLLSTTLLLLLQPHHRFWPLGPLR